MFSVRALRLALLVSCVSAPSLTTQAPPSQRGDPYRLVLGTWELNVAKSRSEEHTSELQSRGHLVCRLLLEKKKKKKYKIRNRIKRKTNMHHEQRTTLNHRNNQ